MCTRRKFHTRLNKVIATASRVSVRQPTLTSNIFRRKQAGNGFDQPAIGAGITRARYMPAMSALRQQPPFANRMLFSTKATWAKDSHELRSPSLHHPISAQSSLLTDDYGGDSEALISDMTEQCRHSFCDHYPLVRNRRRCPEDKWLLDMKRGHQVLFLRLFTKKLVSDPMIFFGWKPPSEATRSPLDRRETCP